MDVIRQKFIIILKISVCLEEEKQYQLIDIVKDFSNIGNIKIYP
jgi:hypothetical protein